MEILNFGKVFAGEMVVQTQGSNKSPSVSNESESAMFFQDFYVNNRQSICVM